MSKCLKRILIISIPIAIILCVANICFSIKFDGKFGNLFTAISGWVSFLATVGIGIIAYLQNKYYQEEAEKHEKFVDVVVENVQVVNHLLVGNKLGRSSVPKDIKLYGNERFYLSVFSYDKPIFDCKITKCLKNGEILLVYDNIQPIRLDMYGKKTLLKNEMMNLTAEIPNGDDFTGKYVLQLEYKNQYGDTYTKDVIVNMGRDYAGKVKGFTQEKSKFIKKGEI